MGIMGRMRKPGSALRWLVATSQAEAGHTFAEPASLQEISLQTAQLLVDEIVGLVNETDCDVGDDFGSAGFNEFAVLFVRLRGSPAELAHVLRFFGSLVPERKIASAEVVFVVVEQFFQAGAGDVG